MFVYICKFGFFWNVCASNLHFSPKLTIFVYNCVVDHFFFFFGILILNAFIFQGSALRAFFVVHEEVFLVLINLLFVNKLYKS